MQIRLVREQYRPGSTIGRMFIDGTLECFTLEDGIRTNKVFGETAIPAGTYRVTVEDSPRFKCKLPRLHGVPNFDGVLIHPGNTPANTLGCILVGRDWTPGDEAIGSSRTAFDALFPKIAAAADRGEAVSIEVVQENAPTELAKRTFRPSKRPSPAKAPARPGTAAKKTVAKKRAAKSGTAKGKAKKAVAKRKAKRAVAKRRR
jgi:hypothetical protein